MTRHPTDDALPPDVARLLEAEREAPAAPADAEARVLARLSTALGLPGGSLEGGAAPPSSPAPPAPPAASAASASAGAATASSTPIVLGVASAVVGAAALAAAVFASSSQPPRAPRAPAASAVPDPVAAPVPLPPVVEAPLEQRHEEQRHEGQREEEWHFDELAAVPDEPARSSRPARRAPVAKDTLSGERALLERARERLSGGDAAAALELAETHRRRFPRGKLVEEREALAVLALARAGRHDEARARARRFEARFPQSLHRLMLRAALEER